MIAGSNNIFKQPNNSFNFACFVFSIALIVLHQYFMFNSVFFYE